MFQVTMSNLRQIDTTGHWGYEEVYGDEARYHEDREAAEACCARLNSNHFGGHYVIEEINAQDAINYSR